jgi:uncharacterized protein (TIGR02246 family)
MGMRRVGIVVMGGGLLTILVCGLVTATGENANPKPHNVNLKWRTVDQETADNDRPADREAIKQTSRDFIEAFEKGDAKALAAAWTDKGEYFSDTGVVLRGRAAFENAYTEYFQEKPDRKIELDIESIYFPSRDTAIEDGVLRMRVPGAELPTSTRYSVLHVREDGKWKVAMSREWGVADDKLNDLAWLVGEWIAKTPDREVTMNFAWNAKKTMIRGTYSAKEGTRVTVTGTQTISFDPATGQLRSWSFDEDGGRGEAAWFRDGNRWVQETTGVNKDGTETTAFNVITRIDHDHFLWRSVERAVGGESAPDTTPVKVSRVTAVPKPAQE